MSDGKQGPLDAVRNALSGCSGFYPEACQACRDGDVDMRARDEWPGVTWDGEVMEIVGVSDDGLLVRDPSEEAGDEWTMGGDVLTLAKDRLVPLTPFARALLEAL